MQSGDSSGGGVDLDVVAERCKQRFVVAMQLANVLLPSDAGFMEASFERTDSRGSVKMRWWGGRWGRRRGC